MNISIHMIDWSKDCIIGDYNQDRFLKIVVILDLSTYFGGVNGSFKTN